MPLSSEQHRPGFIVPLESRDVLRPRSGEFVYQAVQARIDRDEKVIARTLADAVPYLDHPALAKVPQDPINDKTPYWGNNFFTAGDARYAFAFVGHFAPRTIVEIGSGNSTRFLRYGVENFGTYTRIYSIDPAPRIEVESIADEIIRKSVLDIDLSLFDSLEPNDILFWDGSHLVLNGSDVVRLFLEIMPRLRAGVVVHIHDIHLPWEYLAEFSERGYAEQYMLATYLLNTPDCEIILPLYYLYRLGRAMGGVSFWLQIGSAGS